jgi:hypothetical protein
MLHDSLTSSLSRVLQSRGYSIEAFSFHKTFVENERPMALLSGSTMVQAILGQHYEYKFDGEDFGLVPETSDIDLFVAPAAAPAVRSHLVAHGLMLGGLSDTCMQGYGDVPISGELKSDVHHVEKWGGMRDVMDKAYKDACGEYQPEEETGVYMSVPGMGCLLHSELELWHQKEDGEWWLDKEEFFEQYRKKAAAYGEDINGKFMHYFHQTGNLCDNRHDYIRQSTEHRIESSKLADGGQGVLPFNYKPFAYEDAPVDLVVGESGCQDALSLLESVDLTICAASWDGQTFRIREPHLTFNKTALIEPRRLALMANYMQLTLSPTDADFVVEARQEIQETNSQISARERTAIWELDKLGLYEVANMTSPGQQALLAASNCQLLPHGKAKIAEIATQKFHKFFFRLFCRLLKYSNRGIRVLNAPNGALVFAKRLQDHGVVRGCNDFNYRLPHPGAFAGTWRAGLDGYQARADYWRTHPRAHEDKSADQRFVWPPADVGTAWTEARRPNSEM